MPEHHEGLDSADVLDPRRALTLADLFRMPSRRWEFPAAGALLGLFAGVVWLLMPASYQATAVVAVRPVVTDPFSYPGPGADRVVNMTVENGLATGTDVVQAVATATGQSTAAAKAGLDVELPTGTQVLRFRYAAPAPGEATKGANAAADAYLKVRQGIYQKQRDAIVTSYDASITKMSAERDDLRKQLPAKATDGGGTNAPAVTATLSRLTALDTQLGQLADHRAEAAAVDVTPGNVTQIAAGPTVSSRDPVVLYPLVGFLAGLLAGAVTAYGIEAFDRRIRTGGDAAAMSRLPLLAELRGKRFGHREEHLPADLRYLALAVLGQLGPVPHRRIVLLGAKPSDLSAEIATGLALALAKQGHTVRWADLTPDSTTSRVRVMAAASGPVFEPSKADPAQTAALPRMSPVRIEQREQERVALQVGAGKIWLDPPRVTDETMITVVRAGATEEDDRGVRAALEAAAVIVARRDSTRASDLERLAATLRLVGARTLGVAMVTGRD